MYNRRMRDPNDQERIILTGLQRTDGIELSSRALLTDEFSLRGGIGLQDAKYVEADASEQGKRPTNVSRLNGELFVAYQSASDGWFGEAVLWRSAIAMPIVLTPPNCPVMPVSMHVSATNGKLGALN